MLSSFTSIYCFPWMMCFSINLGYLRFHLNLHQYSNVAGVVGLLTPCTSASKFKEAFDCAMPVPFVQTGQIGQPSEAISVWIWVSSFSLSHIQQVIRCLHYVWTSVQESPPWISSRTCAVHPPLELPPALLCMKLHKHFFHFMQIFELHWSI